MDYNAGFKLMSNVVTGLMVVTVVILLYGLSNVGFHVEAGVWMLFVGLGALGGTAGGPWLKMGFWKFMYVVFSCFFIAIMAMWFAMHAAADFRPDGMLWFGVASSVLSAFFVGVLYASLKIVGPFTKGLKESHGTPR